jgi:hypothetical protein
LTAEAALLAVLLTALPAVEPALPTALAAVGLAPDRPAATDPAVLLTLEPTL